MPYKWQFFMTCFFSRAVPSDVGGEVSPEAPAGAHGKADGSTLFRESDTGVWQTPKALIIKLFVPCALP